MSRKRRALWITLVAVLLLAAGGGYYYFKLRATAQPEQGPEIQSTRARRGEIVISATGAGTVIPAAEIDLSFDSGGTLVELNAEISARVKAGDVLARIDDLGARQSVANAELQVAKAELDLKTIQEAHEELLEPASDTEMLNAQAAVTTAQQALDDLSVAASEAEIAQAEAAVATAQDAYQTLLDGPDSEELERAQLSLDKARNGLWSAQMSRDAKGTQRDRESGAYDQAQVSVLNAEISVRQAELELTGLTTPATQANLKEARAKLLQTQEQLAELQDSPSEAEIDSAKAKLATAQEALQELVAGPSDQEIAISAEKVRQAGLSLNQAKMALEAAQQDLAGTALVAPMDGTIMAVEAQVGERVGTAVLITLADVDTPMLEIFVDESDMDKIAVGYEVEVELDALPDQLFTGRVVQVDPALTTESGVQVIRGLVSLDPDSFAKPQALTMNLNATVDVIGGRAANAVLVPVEALRDLGDGEYAVFVVEDGELKLRVVQVGLQDYTYAEIRSGVEVGESVSTGIVETR